MRACRHTIQVAALVFGSWIASQCLAQEPTDPQSTADLRREVTELRATVAELTKRLEAMEYQKIPQAGMPNPELASPKLAELSDAAPGSMRYTGQPAAFPVDVFQLPHTNPAPRRHLPPYLLFPEAIERAMMSR